MPSTIKVTIVGDASSVQKAFAQAAGAAQGFGSRMQSAGSALTSVGKTLTTAVTVPLVGLGVATVKAASDFESSFAGVRKTVDASEQEFQKLAQGIRQMAKEIPLSVHELNGIAEAAGQLGIEKSSILDFTRTVADLGVTTNLTAEEAANAFARFANIVQMPQSQFDRLGSTVVALGNNLATTESELTEFGLRIAGAGKQVGLTEAQIMALGGTLSSVGIRAEAGGTAISTVMLTMDKAVRQGGESLEGFAKVAGVSAKQFAQTWRTDPADAIVAFVEGLSRIQESGGDVVKVLDELGFKNIRVRDALLRTAGAGDLLRRSIELAERAWNENNALTKEAEQRYKTFASQLVILKNRLYDIAITVGNALMPFIKAAIDALDPFVKKLEELSQRFASMDAHGQRMALLGAAIAAGIGPALIVIGQLVRVLGFAASAVGALFTPVGVIVAALGGLAVAVAKASGGWEGFLAAGRRVIDWLKDVTQLLMQGRVDEAFAKIADGVKTAGRAIIDAIGRVNWSEVGQRIGDMVGKAVASINWDAVFGTVSGIATGLTKAIVGVFAGVDWGSLLGNVAKTLASGFWAAVKAAFQAGGELGSDVGYQIGHKLGEFVAKGLGDAADLVIDAAQTMLRGVAAALEGLAALDPTGTIDGWAQSVRGAIGELEELQGQFGAVGGTLEQLNQKLASGKIDLDTYMSSVSKGLSDGTISWEEFTRAASNAGRTVDVAGARLTGLQAAARNAAAGLIATGNASAGASAKVVDLIGAVGRLAGLKPPEIRALLRDEEFRAKLQRILGDVKGANLDKEGKIRVLIEEALRAVNKAQSAIDDVDDEHKTRLTGDASGAVTAAARAKSAIESVPRSWPVTVSVAVTKTVTTVARTIRQIIDEANANVGSTAQEYAARTIGAGIGKGIGEGVARQAGETAARIGSAVRSATDQAGMQASAGGTQMADRLVRAFLLGTGSLPSQLGESVQRALEAARERVQTFQGRMSEAFSDLASYALAAFDRITSEHLTKSEKMLKELREQHDEAQRQAALAQAQAALAKAQAEGDIAAIQAAQQQLADAQYAIQVAALEAQAEQERKAYEDRRELQRMKMAEQLEELQKQLEKHPEQHKKIQKKIDAVLKRFLPEYRASGRNIGLALAYGLRSAIGEVRSAAEAVAKAIADALKTASPTKEGPMSDLDHWWDSFGATLVQGLDERQILRPIEIILRKARLLARAVPADALAGINPASIFPPLRAAVPTAAPMPAHMAAAQPAAPMVVNVNVEGSVTTEEQLVNKIRDGLIRAGKRNGGALQRFA